MKSYFIIDVESVGLHGEGFAVAGGVYLENGAAQWEFCFTCPMDEAQGQDTNREWCKLNIPIMPDTHRTPILIRSAFWEKWMQAKSEGAQMAAECLWPVEANFVAACVRDHSTAREWEGPYPFLEISSVMQAAGMDPMAKYERTPSEMPAHNPLSDARLSARLLADALVILAK